MIAFDDTEREGEHETIEHAVPVLRGRDVDLAIRQTILSAARFRSTACY